MADFSLSGEVVAMKQKTRKDGSVIPGFFGLEVNEDGSTSNYPRKLSVNETTKDGDPTPGFEIVRIGQRLSFFGWTKEDTFNGKPVTYYNCTSVAPADEAASTSEALPPDDDWAAPATSNPAPQQSQMRQAAPAAASQPTSGKSAGTWNKQERAEWALGVLVGTIGFPDVPEDPHERVTWLENKALGLVKLADRVAERL